MYINNKYVRPLEKELDSGKVYNIAEAMKKDGWRGDPILVADRENTYKAINGTHRLAACEIARIEPPLHIVSATNDDIDLWYMLTDYVYDNRYDNHYERLKTLMALGADDVSRCIQWQECEYQTGSPAPEGMYHVVYLYTVQGSGFGASSHEDWDWFGRQKKWNGREYYMDIPVMSMDACREWVREHGLDYLKDRKPSYTFPAGRKYYIVPATGLIQGSHTIHGQYVYPSTVDEVKLYGIAL